MADIILKAIFLGVTDGTTPPDRSWDVTDGTIAHASYLVEMASITPKGSFLGETVAIIRQVHS
jgi:hypothetical protein